MLLRLAKGSRKSMSMLTHKPKVYVDEKTKFVTISPQDQEKHSASMVFAHGLGDSAFGWADSIYEISTKMPHVKFILPTGKK